MVQLGCKSYERYKRTPEYAFFLHKRSKSSTFADKTEMNRYTFAHIMRRLLHLHYDVRLSGMEHILDGQVHLVLPNHTAYIDPILLLAECGDVPLCPMSDERFFRNPIFRHILAMADAVSVPDLEKTTHRAEGAAAASRLSRIAIDSLTAGKEMVFYPSGHIKTIDKEVIGNRRMAYEVCRELPKGVEVVMVRMRGLEGSLWSKLRPKCLCFRRKVYIHFEPMTAQLCEWATTLPRRDFNKQLEDWYNQLM